MKKLIALFILLGAMSFAQANELHDFTSDGCSKSPDGVPMYEPEVFLDCCIKHDVAYWQGGTAIDRLHADQDLRSCIEERGYPEVAKTYYYAVRFGGSPLFNTSYRWGYGWKQDRGYAPLSREEWHQVLAKILKVQKEGLKIQ